MTQIMGVDDLGGDRPRLRYLVCPNGTVAALFRNRTDDMLQDQVRPCPDFAFIIADGRDHKAFRLIVSSHDGQTISPAAIILCVNFRTASKRGSLTDRNAMCCRPPGDRGGYLLSGAAPGV
jgi:hypothetical protein